MSGKPGHRDGPDERPERGSIAEALRLFHTARRGAPTEADAPPPSTLPMTPAARAALELGGGVRNGRRFGPKRRVVAEITAETGRSAADQPTPAARAPGEPRAGSGAS